MKLFLASVLCLFLLASRGTALARFVPATPEVMGIHTSMEVNLSVEETASFEALPQGWEDKKKEDRYLEGRAIFPSSNFLEIDIAALPAYRLEISVKNSLDDACTLVYLPEDGDAEINQSQKKAVVRMGSRLAGGEIKKIRLDLYEDLFTYLGFVLKEIASIKISGKYLLAGINVHDGDALIRAAGAEEIDLPEINISFDDRYYLDTLFSKTNPILIADTPVIKVDFNTRSGLRFRRASLRIDQLEINAAKGEFSLVTVKPQMQISPFDIDYAMYLQRITPDRKLAFGEHKIVFKVQNAYGTTVSRDVFARVVSIPARVEGKPMVFPNPFNPGRGEAAIQYNLSMQTNIEVVIFAVDGAVVSRKRYGMGEEGGKKGYNTVYWDGRSDAGTRISNGIYSGVIIDKDENRILEKFLITVYQ